MKVRVTLTGRSYHLGEGLPAEMELSDDSTVTALVSALNEQLPDDNELPASCLISVSGKHVGSVGNHSDAALSENDEVVFIAPVAGG